MAKKELAQQEKKELTTKQVTKRNSLINAYVKAIASLEKSAWATAKAVYDCVNNEELFPTATAVATALGLNKGTVSKLAKAYALRVGLQVNNETLVSDLSASQLQELLPIYDDNDEQTIDTVAECISVEGINPKDKTKDIRAKVKHFQKGDDSEGSEDSEDTGETAESESIDYYFNLTYGKNQ